VGASVSREPEVFGGRSRRQSVLLSLLHASCSFVDFIHLTCITLTTKLETVEKALAEERVARQVVDQALQASQETGDALTQDLQSAQASITATREKLSSKSVALNELVVQEREAQIKLQILGDEKKAQEQLLESAQKALSKRDFSSSLYSISRMMVVVLTLRPCCSYNKLVLIYRFE
jgi:septal ring factor EnvC (AmiA/AmiB activator)